MTPMEDVCDFAQGYVPPKEAMDDPLPYHLKNCSVCQQEIRLVDES